MCVFLYSKPNCPNCDLTKRDMDILGIEYKVIDLSENPSQAERLIKMGHKSLPVVDTGQQVWSGYNQTKINSLVVY